MSKILVTGGVVLSLGSSAEGISKTRRIGSLKDLNLIRTNHQRNAPKPPKRAV